MITLIAFILTILGCINWLLIGLLQYDYIAGLFGFQASIFSRIIYILFGIGSVYLVLRTIINKGTFKVYEKKKKKQEKNQPSTAYVNAEASKESVSNSSYARENENVSRQRENINENNFENKNRNYEIPQEENENLFDEHFNNQA